MQNCRVIEANREQAAAELKALGFKVIPSKANFIFAESDRISGERLYLSLKERGILVRRFGKERIKNYCRITVGTQEQTDALIGAIKEIFKEMSL